jgi:lincosamide and streptogramin A transport system ATP-binding/permease protein
MSLIKVQNLSFAHARSYHNVFEDVSFSIDTNWKLGFVGRNGKGKTTFLKLLMGKYEHSGTISASVKFDYFPFEIRDKTKNTIDIIDEILDSYEFWELCKEISFLNLSEDIFYRPFESLSNGERTKILLAALSLRENNFLLIDEPTDHLDIEARKTVAKYLNSKSGFILVSHDKNFLDSCTDHILSINRSNIEIQQGNFSSWWQNKEYQDNFEIARNEKLKKDIDKLHRSAKRSAEWSDRVEASKNASRNSGLRPDKGYVGHMAAKMMQRSKNIERNKNRAIEQKSSLLKNIETIDELKLKPADFHKSRIVEASGLSIFYADRQIFKDLSFIINVGERIGLKGKNGCGKTSLIKLILGEKLKFTGDISIASGLKISYISQDVSNFCGKLAEFIENNNIDESLFKAILRKLDLSKAEFEKDIRELSAGQKKKILIAKSLCERAHLYVWDEPLNFIDIISRMQIENLILKYCPTMLFVEHDKAFYEKIATKFISL